MTPSVPSKFSTNWSRIYLSDGISSQNSNLNTLIGLFSPP